MTNIVYIERAKLKKFLDDQERLWSIALPIIEQAEKESPIPGFEVVHKPLESLSEFLAYVEMSNAE
jgi:hypothetical protein